MRVRDTSSLWACSCEQSLTKKSQTDSKLKHEFLGEFMEAAQESGFHVISEPAPLDLVPQRQEAPSHEPYIIHRLIRGDEETKI